MRALLYTVLFVSVAGYRLTQEDNDHLQEICGRTFLANESADKSMNTSMSSRNEAPFTVQIRRSKGHDSPEERLNKSKSVCSGTIISQRHILTAAHCFTRFKMNLRIRCGNSSVELPRLSSTIVVAPTICHLENNSTCDSQLKSIIATPKRVYLPKLWAQRFCSGPVIGTIRGDVAIIELEEDIQFSPVVQPACLASFITAAYSRRFTLYGYGTTGSRDPATDSILRKHVSTPVSQDKCRTYKKPGNIRRPFITFDNMTLRIMDDELCTVNQEEQPCRGDSGGGQVVRRQNKTYVTAAISWGPAHCSEAHRYPEGFVGVSSAIFPHLEWIWAATGISPYGHVYPMENIENYMEEAFILERPSTSDPDDL